MTIALSTPWTDLLQAIDPDEINVYGLGADALTSPALVLRPAEPWIAADAFQRDQERYYLVAAVNVGGDITAALDELHALVHTARRVAAATGWQVQETSEPIVTEEMAVPMVASRTLLLYSDCAHETLEAP